MDQGCETFSNGLRQPHNRLGEQQYLSLRKRINDGKYAYNNLQQYDGTWYHKFSKTWHTATEAYLMYQRDVPSTSGPIKPQPNTTERPATPAW